MWTPRFVVKAIVLVLVMDVQTTLVWLAMVTCYTLRPFSLKWFYVYLAHLLELWAQHLVFLIQYFAPCDLVITVDQSCTKWTKADGSSEDNGIEEVIRRKNNGSIETIAFPSRIAVMSNHQVNLPPSITYSYLELLTNYPKRYMQIGFTSGALLILQTLMGQ